MENIIEVDGKVYRAMNPLGEEELGAAKKNREKLAQLVRPYTVMDTRKQAYAKRWYRGRDRKR